MSKHSAVYVITNNVTGEQYVGASRNVFLRMGRHIGLMLSGTHDNPRLQAAWDEHGEIALDFEIVEHVEDVTQLNQREQAWIDRLQPAYNRVKLARGRPKGSKHSPEVRKRISDAVRAAGVGRPKGFVVTDETRERIKAALAKDPEGLKARQQAATEAARQVVTGTHKSEEERQRISETMTGRTYSDERRANISRRRKGVKTGPPSEEHRRHLSEANKGQDTSKAAEASAAARRGKALSEEHKRKVGEALKGKKRPPRTAEHSEKLRLAALERQARLRAERQHQQADAVE